MPQPEPAAAGRATGGLGREHRGLGASRKRLGAEAPIPLGSVSRPLRTARRSPRSAAGRHRARARGRPGRHGIPRGRAHRLHRAPDLQRHSPGDGGRGGASRLGAGALERRVPGPGRAGARAARCQRRRGALPLGLHARSRAVRGALGDSARPPAWRTRRARRLGECRREPVGVGGRTRAGGARRYRAPGTGCARAFQACRRRSEYAAWWRMPVSSFSRRRTSRSRGGTEASTSTGRRRSISRARWRRRSQHSTRTTPTTSARTFGGAVEPYVDGGELVFPGRSRVTLARRD